MSADNTLKYSRILPYDIVKIHLAKYNAATREINKLTEPYKAKSPEPIPCPEYDPFNDDNRIKAYFFEGAEYNGSPARIFAYIGFPENAAADKPVPGMLLIHGGAGHAYAEWVQKWVDRGYAAVSFDGFGQSPEKGEYKYDVLWDTDPNSHPTIDEFASYEKPITEQWYWYYLTDAILAGNILRNDKRVRSDMIGATGISWGGYLLTTLLGYDDRFAFAVPVYGCGYQQYGSGIFTRFTRNIYDKWEPSLLLPNVKTDILFVNSDSDIFFSANTTSHSAAYAINGKALFIHEKHHSQDAGSDIEEVFRFADEHSGLGEGNIKISDIGTSEEGMSVKFDLPADAYDTVAKAYYHSIDIKYDTTEPFTIKESWKCISGEISDSCTIVGIPKKACIFYISVEAQTAAGTISATTSLFRRVYGDHDR